MASILVIDDEPLVRRTIRVALERAGHQVVEAPNGRIGMGVLAARAVDMVITDILMPEQEGIETILALRRAGTTVKILAISGGARCDNADFLDMAEKLGADDTLGKPFEVHDLLEKVTRLCGNGATPTGAAEPR